MIIKTANRLAHVKEYYFSKKLREIATLRAAGAPIINLGIGSPDRTPPESAITALQKASTNPQNHAYQSYKGAPQLREAIAQWYNRQYLVNLNADTEILPLLGSKEGIMHISMTWLENGDEVLVPNPGYPAYAATARLAGATPIFYDLSDENNWLPDFKALEQTDLQKVKIMWVNYPHMPTGARATKDIFEQLIAFGKRHQILICNDNPYSFILNETPLSLLEIPGAKDIALELNSLSKSYNMAGWRVGMVCGSSENINSILTFKSNMDSGMFLPVQLAAAAALHEDNDWFTQQNKVYTERRTAAWKIMDELQCTYSKTQAGMFVWAKIPSTLQNVQQLVDDLLYEQSIFITPGFIFGTNGERYIRISLCSNLDVLNTALNRIITSKTLVK